MSLIAHYKLNDNLATTNVIDSKVSYDGTLVGGNNTEDLSAVGKINESLHFDGNADYITTTLKFNAIILLNNL